jgi:acyl dehydratase
MPTTYIENIARLQSHVGQEVCISDWLGVTQERINKFAEATEDRQWIHVDVARAAEESPFGMTIAHGFLTLSLLSIIAERAIAIRGVRMAVNYGLNRVRFTAPVLAGTRIRGRFTLAKFENVKGGVQITWNVTVECDRNKRPCCIAEWLVRYHD